MRRISEGLKAALKWLGVEEGELWKTPRLTTALSEVGNKDEIINTLRRSDAKEAQAIIALVDVAPTKQFVNDLPLEAFCLATGISTKRFFALVAEVVFEENQNRALLIASKGTPDVVEATIRDAKKGSAQDKKFILQHGRLVPVPRTSFVTFIGNPNIDAGTKIQNVALPVTEDAVRRMGDKFNLGISSSPKGLLGGSPVMDVEEGESEDEV